MRTTHSKSSLEAARPRVPRAARASAYDAAWVSTMSPAWGPACGSSCRTMSSPCRAVTRQCTRRRASPSRYSRVTTSSSARSRDRDVDQMYNALFREFLTYMVEDPRNITPCMHLHFIAKNIERMGDHATTIAEQVIYLITGTVPDEPRIKGESVMPADLGDGED